MKFIQVRASEEFKQEVKDLAEKKGFNVSNYIRHLIIMDKENEKTNNKRIH